MDFYFQDQLRWSYGFDNPNKAAALISGLLPLLWILSSGSARVGKPVWKWSALLISLAILCFGWWLLFKTYSRGGIVAAILAFGYIGFVCRRRLKGHLVLTAVCCLVIIGLFITTHAAERSVGSASVQEGSVVNRFSVWRGGLEMLAENPQGVGIGKSGEAYMRWYQPLESTEHYRTLVNSYLTFAVEQGLAVFSAVFFASMLLWNITGSSKRLGFSGDVRTGLKASLLAVAIAGVFSTTMEEWSLWILPLFCIVVLLGMKQFSGQGEGIGAQVKRSALISLGFCGFLYASGCLLARNEQVRITLSRRHGSQCAEIQARKTVPTGSLYVVVDEQVMGDDYGKLLRHLALETGMRIAVSDTLDAIRSNDTVMAAGEGVNLLHGCEGKNLILLAPSRIEEAEAMRILRTAKSVSLLLPGFDEDERVAFWTDLASKQTSQERISVQILDGVGTRVDWGWEGVIAAVKEANVLQRK